MYVYLTLGPCAPKICKSAFAADRQTDTNTNEGTLVWLVTCVSISCVGFSTYVATNLLVCLLKNLLTVILLCVHCLCVSLLRGYFNFRCKIILAIPYLLCTCI